MSIHRGASRNIHTHNATHVVNKLGFVKISLRTAVSGEQHSYCGASGNVAHFEKSIKESLGTATGRP